MYTKSIKNLKTNNFIGLLLSAVILTVLSACATAPDTEVGKSDLKRDADAALKLARSTNSDFDSIIRNAPGYAVFPSVGKGAFGVGGAYGRGILYQNGEMAGYTDLSQATFGFQLGGQKYTEILVFENANAINNFRQGNFEFSAQATAVALMSGKGVNAKFRNGVAVFTMNESGLMYEASIGGQKFTFQPLAGE